MIELEIGDAVEVHEQGGGELSGHVTAFERDGEVAVVTPDDEAVQRLYPKGYKVGSAHWGTLLVRRP